MKNITQYELKMFSSNLVESPQIVFDGMDIVIELKGYDVFHVLKDNSRTHDNLSIQPAYL